MKKSFKPLIFFILSLLTLCFLSKFNSNYIWLGIFFAVLAFISYIRCNGFFNTIVEVLIEVLLEFIFGIF